MKNIAIQLINVSKQYTIHHEKPTLVEKFYKGNEEKFWALKNINLTIKKGERMGIIGANGSGKTTLLKIITGITTPSSGTVKTYGKIVSLIDLQAGFHSDLSGYDNIFLNGMLLGMSKKEILQIVDRIIDFADLKGFIDAPLFTYSAGMVMRLGFSVAVHTQPDIVVIDENILVGDVSFQKKADRKLNEKTQNPITVIYVSHFYSLLIKRCIRIIQLENGNVINDGDIKLLT
jgi:ABC-type polysaccharide/polyol phosphate transport system ATPase subunit